MAVFGALNEQTLELITRLAVPVRKAAGEHFFLEGDAGDDMYVLRSGEVEIYKTWRSEERMLALMKAGDCFGEMALVDLFPRSASARAAKDCEALQIAPTVPQAIYAADPEQFTLLQMNMSREISRRMRRVDDMLFRAMMGDAPDETLIDPLT